MADDYTLKLPCPVGKVSDGFHTFDELYEHRCLLFLNLLRLCPQLAWRSSLHDDGTMFEGWFIAGMETPWGQITYHLPNDMWLWCNQIREVEKAPKWDGHTPANVCERLRMTLEYIGDLTRWQP